MKNYLSLMDTKEKLLYIGTMTMMHNAFKKGYLDEYIEHRETIMTMFKELKDRITQPIKRAH